MGYTKSSTLVPSFMQFRLSRMNRTATNGEKKVSTVVARVSAMAYLNPPRDKTYAKRPSLSLKADSRLQETLLTPNALSPSLNADSHLPRCSIDISLRDVE